MEFLGTDTKVGDKVKARIPGALFNPTGEVINIFDDMYLVKFSDDEQAWVNSEFIWEG
jgi:hypothetical protein